MVVTAIEREVATEGAWDAGAPRKLDLHAWVAIGISILVAAGTLTISAIAYAHVP